MSVKFPKKVARISSVGSSGRSLAGVALGVSGDEPSGVLVDVDDSESAAGTGAVSKIRGSDVVDEVQATSPSNRTGTIHW